MIEFRFTGNPFVDAGIAGICAAANVGSLKELNEEVEKGIERAFGTLLDVMTSDAMFKERLINKKAKSFATSEMASIFPNGPLSQSSYPNPEIKRRKYEERVKSKYGALKKALIATNINKDMDRNIGLCFVDGSPAIMRVGNDEFPLVDSKSKRNFHPALQGGHPVGAVAAMALEFFPFSVLRTGVNTGFLWFVHTAVERIAIACAQLTLKNMQRAIARGDGLGFYGDWDIPSRDPGAALVALIRDLMSGRNQRALSWQEIDREKFPVTAYVFSNDNRAPNITAHDLPHRLFFYFAKLHPHKFAFDRFNHEVLQNGQVGWRVAKRMLSQDPILTVCLIHSDKGRRGHLQGSWLAHSLYASEVLGMSSLFIRVVEEVSERIVRDDRAKDLILMLQRDAIRALLDLSRKGLVSFEQYAQLLPPDAPQRSAANVARDYLLAAIYERQAAEEEGQSFRAWEGDSGPIPQKHSLITMVEQIGSKLVMMEFRPRTISDLAKAQRLYELRGAVLRLIRQGILSWNDFVNIFPPDQPAISFQFRDYLLAYLYSALRGVELPEPEPVLDRMVEPVNSGETL
jgi:CRISPR-associated protein Cst1